MCSVPYQRPRQGDHPCPFFDFHGKVLCRQRSATGLLAHIRVGLLGSPIWTLKQKNLWLHPRPQVQESYGEHTRCHDLNRRMAP